jgi:hypothetical protein
MFIFFGGGIAVLLILYSGIGSNMKSVFFGLVSIVLIPGLTKPAHIQEGHKHGHHESVFFKINGQQAIVYPIVKRSSLANFILPDYKSPRDYLVKQQIDIEINPLLLETEFIKAHNSTIPDARFIWELGDGQRAFGTRNRHRYRKAGSYLLSIYIESKLFDAPLLFKTVLIHILPFREYRLPKAVITINNQSIPEHYQDALRISFTEPIQLEGTRSVPGSTKIITFLWDLSDRTSSRDPKLRHAYNRSSYNATPVLRVKDSMGFISDACVEIINKDTTGEKSKQ